MAEFKETRVVKSTSGESHSSATTWLAFVVGVLLITAIGAFFLNMHGSVSGPGGNVQIDIKSPIAAPANPAR